MAAKSWEADFRYPAIQESMKLIREERPDDIFDCSHSFCIPVGNRPVIGWTPGKIFIIALVLGFVLLGAAAFVTAGSNDGNGENPAIIALGAVLGLSGMACFFLPAMADRFIMRLLTGTRGGNLVRRGDKLLCAEISHTDRSKMKIEIDGDDYILMLPDRANRRLLIEGIAARYLIRGEDVLNLQPFQFLNYVGAEITYRIGENVSLSIAIARVSLLLELTRQLPFLFFLQKRINNRILATCEETLGWINESSITLFNGKP